MPRFSVFVGAFSLLSMFVLGGNGCNQILDWEKKAPAVCGDGVIEAPETCEPDRMSDITCRTFGYEAGEVTCRNCQLVKECHTCGDGRAEFVEDCDGADLRGKSCASLGYYGGDLSCTGTCMLDLRDCRDHGRCGDDVLQESEGELCDGWELGGRSCADFDFWGGTLFCGEFCRYFDTYACASIAGFAAGAAHAVLVDEGNVWYAWGDNARFQAGVSGTLAVIWPAAVSYVSCALPPAVRAGFDITCLHCAPEQSWLCLGDNRFGQLGLGDTQNRSALTPLPGLGQPWVDLAPGRRHLCAVDRFGRAACAGANDRGQLGDGTRDQRVVLGFAAASGVSFLHVASGEDFSCALDAAGGAWCWGANDRGQLGVGTVEDSDIPLRLDAGVPFLAVSAGSSHACALDLSQNAWCWGANDSGQLGIGRLGDVWRPEAVHMPPASRFEKLACGGSFCCGVDQQGRIWCWGANGAGQLGIGAGPDRSEPQMALSPPGESFVDVSAGESFACAWASSGRLYCWGSNHRGQLGNGTFLPSSIPQRVVP